MSVSKAIFYFCIAFVSGICLESITQCAPLLLWGAFVLGVVGMIVSLFTYKHIGIYSFCLLFLILGVSRMQIGELEAANNRLIPLHGQEVTFTGTVIAEPDIRERFQQLMIEVNGSIVLITTRPTIAYRYYDTVSVTGKLEEPSETETFSYKQYLLKDGIYSVMAFPDITVTSNAVYDRPGSFFYQKILDAKALMRGSIDRYFLPPHSSILKGMLLGDNALSSDFKQQLNVTGLSHIIAVSGTHIVILASVLMSVLMLFGLWRQQAFYVVVVTVIAYVILVGAPASAVRAGIMGILFLLSQQLGRQALSSRIIVLAGTAMLAVNPFLLLYDVGFQLSFLAVLGLIYVDPLIKSGVDLLSKKYWGRELSERSRYVLGMVSVTLSAQLFTLPIIIYDFGNISYISPLTNLLVLPVVPYIMGFGFLCSFVGTFWGWLGWVISIPCYSLLSYFAWVVKSFSGPWAYAVQSISVWWMLALYVFIVSAVAMLHRKYSLMSRW